MSASVAQKIQYADILNRTARTMRQLGIAGFPRNYELIYEVMTGANPQLGRELNALGQKPAQEDLDALCKKYIPHMQTGSVMDGVHSKMTKELELLLRLLKQEQSSLESYSRLLGETYSRINSKSTSSSELLSGVISILSEATGDTMERGKEIVASVNETSSEMEQVKLELDEYKRIANTDQLTRLSNRRAFDEIMAQIYSDPKTADYHAILLIDIDHFKKFNDTFGHPIGDRVLGIVANVFKSNLRNDVFIARTGGEEFAIILQGTSAQATAEIGERLRRAVENTPFKNHKTGTDYGRITISVGACMASQAENADDLYRKVDLALYAAKSAGRNRVEAYADRLADASQSEKLIYRRGVA